VKNRPLVLVADDQPEILRLVRFCLAEAGYRVATAADGREALERVADLSPDLLVIDIGMPELDGLDVIRELRAFHPLPVIILTASASTRSISEGLDVGADDYIVKPFHPDELVARVGAVIRRAARSGRASQVDVGDLVIDLDRREVRRDGRPLPVSRREWLLLQHFAQYPGRILRHEELLSAVWGPEYRDDHAYLRIWIGQLRRTLGLGPWEEGPIRTVHGLGYVLDVDGRIPPAPPRRPRQGGEETGSARAAGRDATGDRPATRTAAHGKAGAR
jgi:two-component system KDP operon response regulator KdpE